MEDLDQDAPGADETTTQSTQHGWVEQPILPASAWRTGFPGTAWVLCGADPPVQVDLIDPDTTPPFAQWLRPEVADLTRGPQGGSTCAHRA